jgi:membrane protein implicated in regulation of membrane protease activity
MYAALWNVLPGPVWLRVLLALALAVAALYVLVTWVFPWVDTLVNNQEATVGNP